MAYLKIQGHFWSGVFQNGQVSDPCVPLRLCSDMPYTVFDNFLLDFFIDSNVYYQDRDSSIASLGAIYDSTPACGQGGVLDADCWQSLGIDPNSVWAPDKEEQNELYTDPDNYFADTVIRGLCCVELWRCTGDLDFSPIDGSPELVCSDPTKLTFIQHLPSDIGPAGFSSPDPHDAFDAKFERIMYCGACGENGLLADIPSSL